MANMCTDKKAPRLHKNKEPTKQHGEARYSEVPNTYESVIAKQRTISHPKVNIDKLQVTNSPTASRILPTLSHNDTWQTCLDT